MKLVELLVKELEEWPEGVTYFVQDGDREVKAASGYEPIKSESSCVWIRRTSLNNYNFYSGLCTDWQTSIVTKDIYTKHKEETQMKQDFRNTKIRIKSEEHSKAIQEAVFAAGGGWRHSGQFYRGGVNFIFLNDSLGMTLGDNAVFFQEHDYKEIQFPLPTKGHVHAELMAQYADDAETTDKPWKLWEYSTPNFRGYKTCFEPITFLECNKYRRKPKTHIVNGVEIPVFEFTPKVGEKYYAANVGLPEFFEHGYRSSECDAFTQRMIERGLIYPCTEEGKKAAILHSKIMLGIITS